MVDVAVIGAGPAGLSVAINVIARNKTVEIFGRSPETSLLYKAENINNHLGFPNMTGKDMIDNFVKHTENLNIKINKGRVISIQPFGDMFMINQDNNIYEAKSVIIATGITKKSTIKNESDFIGKGLSYCATCDGMFYRNKDVVIYGEIPEAEEDANFLAEICSSVTFVHSYDDVKEVDERVKLIKGKVNEVFGEEMISKVVLNDNQEIECSGLFVIKGSINASNLIDGIELENNMIKVNSNMETNIKGLYACGDCVGGLYQVSKAIGEGLIAGQMAVKYVNTL
ncbi:MAG: NAD(P)/FAD-dependent oxidoreductase [Lachnospirales bacterium]